MYKKCLFPGIGHLPVLDSSLICTDESFCCFITGSFIRIPGFSSNDGEERDSVVC